MIIFTQISENIDGEKHENEKYWTPNCKTHNLCSIPMETMCQYLKFCSENERQIS